ncbi:MAG: 1-acyl-sn-glycerol-3-phosphate acyltransferase [Sphingomonadaceae bacterium]|nr:1-acyl-sn-glycerol-3-phosphate acyltransferase [Sphingomonadaceae bacterium]
MPRLIFRVAWLTGLIALCVPFHLLRGLLGIRSPWPRRFLGWCASAVGLKATVLGKPREGATLYVANHQSWTDILVIGGATGASFVSKEEVRKWPVAGWLATMVGTIYINRDDRREAGAQAARIREELARGKSVVFFPEGQISHDEHLLPFRPALFGAVVPPVDGVAVQPIALDYGEHKDKLLWRRGTHAGLHAVEMMKRPGRRPVTVHLLEPIVPEADAERREIANACHDAIARALGQPIRDEIE